MPNRQSAAQALGVITNLLMNNLLSRAMITQTCNLIKKIVNVSYFSRFSWSDLKISLINLIRKSQH